MATGDIFRRLRERINRPVDNARPSPTQLYNRAGIDAPTANSAFRNQVGRNRANRINAGSTSGYQPSNYSGGGGGGPAASTLASLPQTPELAALIKAGLIREGMPPEQALAILATSGLSTGVGVDVKALMDQIKADYASTTGDIGTAATDWMQDIFGANAPDISDPSMAAMYANDPMFANYASSLAQMQETSDTNQATDLAWFAKMQEAQQEYYNGLMAALSTGQGLPGGSGGGGGGGGGYGGGGGGGGSGGGGDDFTDPKFQLHEGEDFVEQSRDTVSRNYADFANQLVNAGTPEENQFASDVWWSTPGDPQSVGGALVEKLDFATSHLDAANLLEAENAAYDMGVPGQGGYLDEVLRRYEQLTGNIIGDDPSQPGVQFEYDNPDTESPGIDPIAEEELRRIRPFINQAINPIYMPQDIQNRYRQREIFTNPEAVGNLFGITEDMVSEHENWEPENQEPEQEEVDPDLTDTFTAQGNPTFDEQSLRTPPWARNPLSGRENTSVVSEATPQPWNPSMGPEPEHPDGLSGYQDEIMSNGVRYGWNPYQGSGGWVANPGPFPAGSLANDVPPPSWQDYITQNYPTYADDIAEANAEDNNTIEGHMPDAIFPSKIREVMERFANRQPEEFNPPSSQGVMQGSNLPRSEQLAEEGMDMGMPYITPEAGVVQGQGPGAYIDYMQNQEPYAEPRMEFLNGVGNGSWQPNITGPGGIGAAIQASQEEQQPPTPDEYVHFMGTGGNRPMPTYVPFGSGGKSGNRYTREEEPPTDVPSGRAFLDNLMGQMQSQEEPNIADAWTQGIADEETELSPLARAFSFNNLSNPAGSDRSNMLANLRADAIATFFNASEPEDQTELLNNPNATWGVRPEERIDNIEDAEGKFHPEDLLAALRDMSSADYATQETAWVEATGGDPINFDPAGTFYRPPVSEEDTNMWEMQQGHIPELLQIAWLANPNAVAAPYRQQNTSTGTESTNLDSTTWTRNPDYSMAFTTQGDPDQTGEFDVIPEAWQEPSLGGPSLGGRSRSPLSPHGTEYVPVDNFDTEGMIDKALSRLAAQRTVSRAASNKVSGKGFSRTKPTTKTYATPRSNTKSRRTQFTGRGKW